MEDVEDVDISSESEGAEHGEQSDLRARAPAALVLFDGAPFFMSALGR